MMFVTTNTAGRKPIFGNAAHAKIAVETLYQIQHYYPFFLYAFVVMPDHCHLLVNVPKGGTISKIVGVWKRAVCFNIGQGKLWQSRFHLILPENSRKIIEYIHMNPVLKGLCERYDKYPWSSASGRWDVQQLDIW